MCPNLGRLLAVCFFEGALFGVGSKGDPGNSSMCGVPHFDKYIPFGGGFMKRNQQICNVTSLQPEGVESLDNDNAQLAAHGA